MDSKNNKMWTEILSFIKNIDMPHDDLIIEDLQCEPLEKSFIKFYKKLPIDGRECRISRILIFRFSREFLDDYLSDPDQMAPILIMALTQIKKIIENFDFDTATHEKLEEPESDKYVINELGSVFLRK